MLAVATLTVVAACGSVVEQRRHRWRERQLGGGQRRPRCRCRRPSARARASSTSSRWAGYAEDGSKTDKTVDWVTPFEKPTGCKVNVKIGNTSDEMVTLMKTGQYDGVSASGDATLRLIYGGDVAPVNTDAGAELRDDRAVPQGPAVELGRRPDVRHPARLGRQRADVEQGAS